MSDRVIDLFKSGEFWGRVVTLAIFVLGWFGVGTDNIDPAQISNLIVAIVGALVIFDPFKLLLVVLEFLGIVQPSE
jgi:hypothetical protein